MHDFYRVCNGCPHGPSSGPDGVEFGSTWLILLCESSPTGTSAERMSTTTRTLTLGKGLYRDSTGSEEFLKCY